MTQSKQDNYWELAASLMGMTRTVTVCSKCKRATCWLGIFPCDEAYEAGTIEMTVIELNKLDREHSSYWGQGGE